MKHYEIMSRRIAGFAVGDIVSEEELVRRGISPKRRVATHHIREADYNEEPKPRKRQGARKDGSDRHKE
jgi:hypothetical protein